MFTGESYIGDTAKAPIFNLSFFRQFCNGLIYEMFVLSDGPRYFFILSLADRSQVFENALLEVFVHFTTFLLTI
jgi:hypothetical protein